MLRPLHFITVFAVGFVVSAAHADDIAWQVGFASRDITPEEPLFLAGYASRNRPYDEVVTPLFVKALAIEDASGHTAVLVTSDIIGYRLGAAEAVCERLQAETGLERRDILLNSSHTHTGPTLMLDVEDRSESMTLEQAHTQIAWTELLVDMTVEAAIEALDTLAPARLSFGIGLCPFVMNRREWTPDGVRLGFNPGGYADRAVPMLRIDDLGGNLRGVLFGAATHNTTPQADYIVCGDYAGFAQTYVENEYPEAQAMFMLGCAGSANPYPRGSLELSMMHGETLGIEICRLLETELTPIEGPLTTAFETVDLPLQEPPTREEIDRDLSSGGGWRPAVARAMLELLEAGEPIPTTFDYPMSVWQFGDDLTLVGLSGEVVGEFVPLIQRSIGPGQLWTAAYCHDVFGYVPTASVLEDGGYETRGAYYRGPGYFAPEADGALVEHVRRISEEVGRPASHFADSLAE